VRETLAKVITFFHNHWRWMQFDAYPAVGLPVGTGVVESGVRVCGEAPHGERRQALESGGGRDHSNVALAEAAP
jgi:hypothetical protein